MRHSVLYIFSLLMVLSCSPTVPDEYIQPGDMEDILYDYHVAQAMARTKGGSDAELTRKIYIDAVLQKYGVSEADFDSSLVYYYSRADKLKDIYANVTERLSDDAKQLGAAISDINMYSQYSSTGDTANIWNQASSLLLIPRPTQNRFEFTVEVDTAFHLGDSFMFQFVAEHLYQTGSKDAVVCIVSKYEGDSIIQSSSHVTVSGLAQIRVPANKENRLKEMKGFIYLNDGGDQSETRKIMYVSQIQLIRFHDKTLTDVDGIEKNEDGTAKKDSVQADSIKRADNTGRKMPDTLRRRIVTGRPGNAPIPPHGGAAKHRMDAGPVKIIKSK